MFGAVVESGGAIDSHKRNTVDDAGADEGGITVFGGANNEPDKPGDTES